MLRLNLTTTPDGHTQWTPDDGEHPALDAPAEATAADLLRIACDSGLADDDAALFADDGDEPLDASAPLASGDGVPQTLLIAPRKRIEVTIHHDGSFVGRHVSRAMRVGRLRRLATEAFDLSGDEADLHVLQIADTEVRPDERRPVGSLDRNHDGEIALDLVRVRPVTVTITVDNNEHDIRPGRRSVARIKQLGGVHPADVLEQIIDGTLTELPDDGHVQIEGDEVFISHPRDSASS